MRDECKSDYAGDACTVYIVSNFNRIQVVAGAVLTYNPPMQKTDMSANFFLRFKRSEFSVKMGMRSTAMSPAVLSALVMMGKLVALNWQCPFAEAKKFARCQ
jgi:hypothetical protein